MALTYPFQRRIIAPRGPTPRIGRPPGNKFQEIAERSPKDIAAFERLVDLVLARLHEETRPPRT